MERFERLMPALLGSLGVALATTASASEWAATYGGFDDDVATTIDVRAAGGVRVAGSTEAFGTEGRDVLLAEVGSDGSLLSQRACGGLGDDYAAAVLETSGGGAIVAATSSSFGAGDTDLWLFEVGSDGIIDWQRRYGGSGDEFATALVEVSGGYVLGGTTASFGAGDTDLWVLRLDALGNVIWQYAYGGIDGEALGGLQPTSDGGVVLAGFTFTFDLPDGVQVGNGDFWVVKLDANGAIQWEKSFGYDFGGSQNSEWAPSVWPTVDGGYVVAGTSAPWPTGGADAWVLKLDSSGGIEWQQIHEGGADLVVRGVQQTVDLGYAVWGSRGESDGWIMKLDSLGAVSWQKQYGASALDADDFFAVRQIADGGYVAAGSTESLGIGGEDAWGLELDANGAVSGCAAIAATSGSVAETFESGVNSSATVTATTAAPVSTTAFVTELSGLQGNGCELEPVDWIDLQQTGQTIPYGVGDDGDLRAGVAWPSPRFDDHGNGTITDRLTGLMWLKDASCHESIGYDPNGNGRLAWAQALDFVSDVNSGVHDISPGCASYSGSHTDWRLPNINELETLVHSEQVDLPAWLVSQSFQNVKSVVSGSYWSSTTHTSGSTHALIVQLGTHRMRHSDKVGQLHLWLVRAGQTELPDPAHPANVWRTGQTHSYYPGDDGDHERGVVWPGNRYQDQGDGTVVDSLTGLMWLKDAACLSRLRWPDALYRIHQFSVDPVAYACEDYAASYTDWRLPNRREMRSVVDYSLFSSAVPDSAPFVGIGGGPYWTSSTLASNPLLAWGVSIATSSATMTQYTKQIYYEGVWAVRGEPVPEPAGPAAIVASLLALAALARGRLRRSSTGPPLSEARSSSRSNCREHGRLGKQDWHTVR